MRAGRTVTKWLIGSLMLGASHSSWAEPVQASRGAPNIVLILLDDVGFAASSTFGGVAETPALHQLAAHGLKYNRFHVSSLCSPTRAALLSGRNPHRIGFGTVSNAATSGSGYNGIWNRNAASIADVLGLNGYNTAAFGKWHNTPYAEISPVGPFDRWPTGLGFDYFYGSMLGADNQWEPTALYRNTTQVAPTRTADQGYHFTTDITDEAIRWVHTQESLAPGKPYFLYFATQATHFPLHVPKEWIARYRGRFDAGWDELRRETFERQKKLGVIPATAELTPRPREIPAWRSLSADQRKVAAREMEVFAAFLAHTDHEIGRLLKVVREGPRGDNTLILYVADDNGAEGGAGVETHPGSLIYRNPAALRTALEQLGDLGGRDNPGFLSAGWAWANNTPFQGMKHQASHFGGTRVPLVLSWPARIPDPGSLRSQFAHATDVAPTLYEAAGIEFPDLVDGNKQLSLDGTSLLHTLDEPQAPSRHRLQLFESSGNRAIYQDGWVAAARHMWPWLQPYSADFQQDRWELYHVDEDFSEAHDLAHRHPGKLQELQALFDKEARRNDVYPLRNYSFARIASLAGDRQGPAVFYPGVVVPAFNGPELTGAFTIEAQVELRNSREEGGLASAGSPSRRFVLYVQGDRLVYESVLRGDKRRLVSVRPLPRGAATLSFEFTPEPRSASHASSSDASAGRGRLLVNGQLAGEGEVVVPAPWGSFSVGRVFTPSPGDTFEPPFSFTGELKKVTVTRP